MNTVGPLIDAWYEMLAGNVFYNSAEIPVYKGDIPEEETGHYILLRTESESDQGNKSSFVDQTVMIVDVVTKFNNNVDTSIANDIDGQISTLARPTPSTNGLLTVSGLQFMNVVRETSSYIHERDGVNVYYRKVSRYTQRVTQL
jgi:hypothetical protein